MSLQHYIENDVKLYEPRYEWPDVTYNNDREHRLPPLLYRRLHYASINPPTNCTLGGSYSMFCELPWFELRRDLCETRYFPYDLNTDAFTVKNGIMMKPDPTNLHVLTDLDDWRVMYFGDNPQRLLGKIIFHEKALELFEFVQ